MEQARTLEAVVKHGSFAKAARALHKVHSAVVYSLKTLEEAAGVPLFDRSGYRTTLTPLGKRVLEHCTRMLDAERELDRLCRTSKEGWEPYLKIVFDGLLPVEPLMRAVRHVGSLSKATRISLYSEFLGEVEARFDRESADVMISVVPPVQTFSRRYKLPPLPSLLVAHKSHPLASKRGRLTLAELESHTFLTVRGSDQRLQMSTSSLEKATEFHLSDFHTKKAALLMGMGYGWMPEFLIESELKKKTLTVLKWGDDAGRHTFQPILYVAEASAGGMACKAFIEKMRSSPP